MCNIITFEAEMAETPVKTSSLMAGAVEPGSFRQGSTLAMGAAARLLYVAVAIALLWLCVWWALQ
jgi:hypothetical protein